jgi:hypothetical protein
MMTDWEIVEEGIRGDMALEAKDAKITRLLAVARAAAALEECTAEMDWGIVHDPESVISRTKEQRKSLGALFLALAAVEDLL